MKKAIFIFSSLFFIFIFELIFLEMGQNRDKIELEKRFISKVALGDFAYKTEFFYVRFNHFSSQFDKRGVDYSLLNRDRLSFVEKN